MATMGGHRRSSLRALGILVPNNVCYVQKRSNGSTEADELRGKNVKVPDSRHLGEAVSGPVCNEFRWPREKS